MTTKDGATTVRRLVFKPLAQSFCAKRPHLVRTALKSFAQRGHAARPLQEVVEAVERIIELFVQGGTCKPDAAYRTAGRVAPPHTTPWKKTHAN